MALFGRRMGVSSDCSSQSKIEKDWSVLKYAEKLQYTLVKIQNSIQALNDERRKSYLLGSQQLKEFETGQKVII